MSLAITTLQCKLLLAHEREIMNLKQMLGQIKRTDPQAVPLAVAIPEQMSREEIAARREEALRRHMTARGASAEQVDAYLGMAKPTHGA